LKKYLPTIVGVFAFLLVGNLTFDLYSQNGFQSTTAQLKKEIAALQSELPSKIDNISTTTGASFDNDILEYDVELDVTLENTAATKFQVMQRNANILAVCLNPKMVEMLKDIEAIEFNYTLKSTDFKFTNVIGEKDCEPFLSEDKIVIGDYYIKLQNSSVPLVLDADTNLIEYRRENDRITLDYQLHSWFLAELDVPYLINYVEKDLVPVMCDAPDFRVLSDQGYEIGLRYLDARREMIYSTTILPQDC
jgi:hypothetical protein